MKRKRYPEEQIAFCLRQRESGTAIEEIIRKRPTTFPIVHSPA
jgi:putative transposase